VLLAKTWDASIDPTGWWMSEKLDGCRSLLDGRDLVSRLDNVFPAPDYFTRHFPNVTLDGELWLGRGRFQECISIVKSARIDKGWERLTYRVFDLPDMCAPFEERYAALHRVADNVPYISVVKQVRVVSMKHLTVELKRVQSLGGEGLMLRQPGSYYERKRSSTLLKVKTFKDIEGRVIGYIPGKGKHKGRLGALVCRLKSGVEVDVGTGFTDYEREHPPRIGSVITIRYQELSTSGTPRFPSYVSERNYE
jgi:DNA ligase-1